MLLASWWIYYDTFKHFKLLNVAVSLIFNLSFHFITPEKLVKCALSAFTLSNIFTTLII